jgi:hypothetical protein
MESGIERALVDLEEIFGDLLEPLRDGVTVAGAECNDL